MFAKKRVRQETMFVPGNLSDYVPEDHILKRVNKVLDLSWLDAEVKGLYSEDVGRPCIEPEKAVRLMLAGFFDGIVKDRKLMRMARVNLAYIWFCGYELGDALPDHSSLTRIRKRWGAKRFKKIFVKTVKQCQEAGLVGGEMTHFDGSLIRADVSWGSLVATHVEKVITENGEPEENNDGGQEQEAAATAEQEKTSPARTRKAGQARKKEKIKKVSKTDPEASMATAKKNQRLEPTYKQLTAVDDKAGVLVDVEVVTGEASEGKEFLGQIERVEETTGIRPKVSTGDKGYGGGRNYEKLEEMGITAVIPPEKERRPKGNMPLCRFRYDAKHDVVRCPAKKILTKRNRNEHGFFYRASVCDCQSCRFKDGCLPESSKARSVLIVDGYIALLRARRKKRQGWCPEMVDAYKRHRYLVEGIHGEEKMEHGLSRAARRGLWNVQIQCYLAGVAVNLKRLADHFERCKGGDTGGDNGFFGRICCLYRVCRRAMIDLLAQYAADLTILPEPA